jgi:hypothetical protein
MLLRNILIGEYTPWREQIYFSGLTFGKHLHTFLPQQRETRSIFHVEQDTCNLVKFRHWHIS